jgi:hypothetical protein
VCRATPPRLCEAENVRENMVIQNEQLMANLGIGSSPCSRSSTQSDWRLAAESLVANKEDEKDADEDGEGSEDDNSFHKHGDRLARELRRDLFNLHDPNEMHDAAIQSLCPAVYYPVTRETAVETYASRGSAFARTETRSSLSESTVKRRVLKLSATGGSATRLRTRSECAKSATTSTVGRASLDKPSESTVQKSSTTSSNLELIGDLCTSVPEGVEEVMSAKSQVLYDCIHRSPRQCDADAMSEPDDCAPALEGSPSDSEDEEIGRPNLLPGIGIGSVENMDVDSLELMDCSVRVLAETGLIFNLASRVPAVKTAFPFDLCVAIGPHFNVYVSMAEGVNLRSFTSEFCYRLSTRHKCISEPVEIFGKGQPGYATSTASECSVFLLCFLLLCLVVCVLA